MPNRCDRPCKDCPAKPDCEWLHRNTGLKHNSTDRKDQEAKLSKYKLVVVGEAGNQEYEIGKFDNEYQLEKWARENLGELKKSQQDQKESQRAITIRELATRLAPLPFASCHWYHRYGLQLKPAPC